MRFTLTLDANDPERLATFWAEALGYRCLGGSGAFWPLLPADATEPVLVIQQVDEPPSGKNRMHLDVHVVDLDAETDRLVALGATRLSADVVAEHDHRWYVMADPEGNEFCVVQRPD